MLWMLLNGTCKCRKVHDACLMLFSSNLPCSCDEEHASCIKDSSIMCLPASHRLGWILFSSPGGIWHPGFEAESGFWQTAVLHLLLVLIACSGAKPNFGLCKPKAKAKWLLPEFHTAGLHRNRDFGALGHREFQLEWYLSADADLTPSCNLWRGKHGSIANSSMSSRVYSQLSAMQFCL